MDRIVQICKTVAIISALFLLLMIVLWVWLPSGKIIVIFNMDMSFYMRFFTMTFLLSVAIYFIKKIRKIRFVLKIILSILSIILLILSVLVGVIAIHKANESHLSTGIVSDNGNHTLYKKFRTNTLNQKAVDYYKRSSFFTYDYVFDCDIGTIPEITWLEEGFIYRNKFYLYN